MTRWIDDEGAGQRERSKTVGNDAASSGVNHLQRCVPPGVVACLVDLPDSASLLIPLFGSPPRSALRVQF